jgi:hypothetical protein
VFVRPGVNPASSHNEVGLALWKRGAGGGRRIVGPALRSLAAENDVDVVLMRDTRIRSEHRRPVRLAGYLQKTMLIAATGVTEILLLRPVGMIRVPAMIPILELKLYSIAGASPSDQLSPELAA